MSAQAIQLAADRLLHEEAFKQFPYNDADGKRVTCKPNGNLSWLIGLNLETAGSMELAEVVLTFLLGKEEKLISGMWWFASLDPVRESVVLDVAYNCGEGGLLHFPKMLAAIGAKDWTTAKAELLNSDAARKLPPRYDKLADILYSGVIV